VSRPRLVVYRALGLGDLLTAVPALRALARAYPGHERVLAAPGGLAPLVELCGGAVDELVDSAPLAPLPPALHGADVVVNLHGRGPESHALLRSSRPRRLIAFGGRAAWRPHEHEVHRWCRLLEAEGIPADPGDLAIEPPAVPPPAGARGATLIHPGAASGARRWPADRWGAVARAEAAAGRAVVVTGGPGEVALARAVAAGAGLPERAVLAGRTGLAELAAAVAAAGRVACGDTGVAHLASALGTPSVVLFGPVPPSEWGPPPGGPHVALWAGRRGDPHAGAPDAGLLAIDVETVRAALASVPIPRTPGRTRRHGVDRRIPAGVSRGGAAGHGPGR
jgi:ADP-heptose:LPS heptosyltransferase